MSAAFSNLSQLVLRIPKASPWSQTCEKRPKVRGTVKLNQGPFNLKSCQSYSKILQNSYLERALRWALYRETKSSYAEHQKNGHSLAALQAINCEQLLVSNCHNNDASLDYCSWHHLNLRHCSYGPMQLARWRTETIDFKRQETFTRYYIHTLEISYLILRTRQANVEELQLAEPLGLVQAISMHVELWTQFTEFTQCTEKWDKAYNASYKFTWYTLIYNLFQRFELQPSSI